MQFTLHIIIHEITNPWDDYSWFMLVKGAPDIKPSYGARPSTGIVLAVKSDM